MASVVELPFAGLMHILEMKVYGVVFLDDMVQRRAKLLASIFCGFVHQLDLPVIRVPRRTHDVFFVQYGPNSRVSKAPP